LPCPLAAFPAAADDRDPAAFFRSIPWNSRTPARISTGCSTFRLLLADPAPPWQSRRSPRFSVLAIVTTWNAFFLPLVILNGAEQWTLPLGAMNFSTEYSSDKHAVMAYTVVTIIPAIIFYAFAERHIVAA
jgi:raffinose/stachyose/melibiose transport system permease protein